MPISRLLRDNQLTPEQQHVLEVAFKHTIRKIGLVDRDDPICALVAQTMVALNRSGVTDAIALTELTLREISSPKE